MLDFFCNRISSQPKYFQFNIITIHKLTNFEFTICQELTSLSFRQKILRQTQYQMPNQRMQKTQAQGIMIIKKGSISQQKSN